MLLDNFSKESERMYASKELWFVEKGERKQQSELLLWA